MPAQADKIDDLLDRFVKAQHVRTKASSYRCALRRFHKALGADLNGLSQIVLRKWLRSQLRDVPIHWVIHQAQLVTRFLDWLVGQKIIAVNPFAELREKYECGSTAGIVRALLSAKPAKALEALRPPPRYGSHLGPVMHDHILRMRSLGFRYGHESEFLRFDRFLQARKGGAGEALSTLIREYAAVVPAPALKLRRLHLGNIVARALNRNGVPTPSIVPDRLLVRDVARKRCRPFIYRHEQIELLLKTAQNYPGRRQPLRPATLFTMLVWHTAPDCASPRSLAWN